MNYSCCHEALSPVQLSHKAGAVFFGAMCLQATTTTFVRRRRWTRHRVPVAKLQNEFQKHGNHSTPLESVWHPDVHVYTVFACICVFFNADIQDLFWQMLEFARKRHSVTTIPIISGAITTTHPHAITIKSTSDRCPFSMILRTTCTSFDCYCFFQAWTEGVVTTSRFERFVCIVHGSSVPFTGTPPVKVHKCRSAARVWSCLLVFGIHAFVKVRQGDDGFSYSSLSCV